MRGAAAAIHPAEQHGESGAGDHQQVLRLQHHPPQGLHGGPRAPARHRLTHTAGQDLRGGWGWGWVGGKGQGVGWGG